jgi:hypothetical protein
MFDMKLYFLLDFKLILTYNWILNKLNSKNFQFDTQTNTHLSSIFNFGNISKILEK